jgi:hypothetical protein
MEEWQRRSKQWLGGHALNLVALEAPTRANIEARAHGDVEEVDRPFTDRGRRMAPFAIRPQDQARSIQQKSIIV